MEASKCPKCGAELTHVDNWWSHFACGTCVSREREAVAESYDCLRQQLAAAQGELERLLDLLLTDCLDGLHYAKGKAVSEEMNFEKADAIRKLIDRLKRRAALSAPEAREEREE